MSKLAVTVDGERFEVEVDWRPAAASFAVRVNGETIPVTMPGGEPVEWLVVDGRPYEIVFDPDLHWLRTKQGIYQIEVRDQDALAVAPRSLDGRIKAPIPGLITHLLVEAGQGVEVNQPLLILEAMKMENQIRAPFGGRVATVHVTAGQSVGRNELLAEVVVGA
jgi:biotin carboxyl carrier protein